MVATETVAAPLPEAKEALIEQCLSVALGGVGLLLEANTHRGAVAGDSGCLSHAAMPWLQNARP